MITLSLGRVRAFAPLGQTLTHVARAHTAWRHRRALRELPDAILHDIGLSRAEVDAEASRPFWDVPTNWRR